MLIYRGDVRHPGDQERNKMDGKFQDGWYQHPQLELIRIFQSGDSWVYQCYSKNGSRALSKERDLDAWTWALSQPTEIDEIGL